MPTLRTLNIFAELDRKYNHPTLLAPDGRNFIGKYLSGTSHCTTLCPKVYV